MKAIKKVMEKLSRMDVELIAWKAIATISIIGWIGAIGAIEMLLKNGHHF